MQEPEGQGDGYDREQSHCKIVETVNPLCEYRKLQNLKRQFP